MAITNHERVGKAMELLRAGLAPFVDREFKSAYKERAAARRAVTSATAEHVGKKPIADWDVAALLKLMWEAWNDIFRRTLGPAERSLLQELRDCRNKWAHQQTFSGDDAYRALDSMSAPYRRLGTAGRRGRQDEDGAAPAGSTSRCEGKGAKAGGSHRVKVTGNLKPWREVVTPHKDVASGRYQQAEFAADLWQVHLGEGADEYSNPIEFFRRTYLTESLKRLLVGAVHRITEGRRSRHPATNQFRWRQDALDAGAVSPVFRSAAPASLLVLTR